MVGQKNKNNKKEKQKIWNVNYRYNLEVYFSFLRKYKLLASAIVLLLLIVGFYDLTVSYLFKIVVDNATQFSSNIIDKITFLSILKSLAIVFLGVVALRFVLVWTYNQLISKIETNMMFDLKKRFFNHLLTLSHGFYSNHKTGSLISRLIRGSGALERMTDVIIYNFLPLIFQLIIIGFSVSYFDPLLMLIMIGTTLVFIGFSVFMQRKRAPFDVEANSKEDIEKANIADIFTNVDSIKYFGKENLIKDKFDKLANTTRLATLRAWKFYNPTSSGQGLILGLGTLLLLGFSINKFLTGQITIGTLVFIYSLYYQIMGPMFGFVFGVRNFYRSITDFEDLFQYGKLENEIKDKPDAKTLKIKEGTIDFSEVNFNYAKRKIFQDFSLRINKNEKIALVGHSGSGKSTLVKLLYRLYDLNSGRILVDGGDIRDFTQESLRGEMAIVPQECILFDDTIYNNIAFSNPKASKQEVFMAIKFAQLDKLIANLPAKEETIVGERGVKLSGGEKQRVSIARAILANKRILVLDEATSSLDSETEHEIQKDLVELMKGRTTMVIAHRLSTIMHADKIIVLKDGKIVQMGKHNDLIRVPGEYAKLWKLQKGGYIK